MSVRRRKAVSESGHAHATDRVASRTVWRSPNEPPPPTSFLSGEAR